MEKESSRNLIETVCMTGMSGYRLVKCDVIQDKNIQLLFMDI